jgi:hypothetical protein
MLPLPLPLAQTSLLPLAPPRLLLPLLLLPRRPTLLLPRRPTLLLPRRPTLLLHSRILLVFRVEAFRSCRPALPPLLFLEVQHPLRHFAA